MFAEHIRHGIFLGFFSPLACFVPRQVSSVERQDTGQRSCTIRSNCKCLPKRATATGIS